MQFDLEIRGTNRVRNQLRAVASFHPNKTDAVIGKHARAERIRLKAKPYPPRLPGQIYRRTGNIANRFFSRKKSMGVWEIGNSALYAAWVIKKGMQNRKYHKGRWWTGDDVLAERMPMLTKALSEKLEAILNGIS